MTKYEGHAAADGWTVLQAFYPRPPLPPVIEVKQTAEDWSVNCDNAAYSTTSMTARTMSPKSTTFGMRNTWMLSSRAPWGGYECGGKHGIQQFFDGKSCDPNPNGYWRASGACAPSCPHDVQTFEVFFQTPAIITKVTIADAATCGGTAHHELLRFLIQRWSGTKWVTQSSFATSSGAHTRETVTHDTKLSGRSDLVAQSWRIYFPSNAVTSADVLHLNELVDFVTEYKARDKVDNVFCNDFGNVQWGMALGLAKYYFNNVGRDYTHTGSEAFCKAECKKLNGCKYFAWSKNSNKHCEFGATCTSLLESADYAVGYAA